MVEIYDTPRNGLADVKVHAYDQDTDTYTISVGDTTGVEVSGRALSIQPSMDLNDTDDWQDAYNAWEG